MSMISPHRWSYRVSELEDWYRRPFAERLDEIYEGASVLWDRDMAHYPINASLIGVYRWDPGELGMRALFECPKTKRYNTEAWLLCDPVPHWLLVKINGLSTRQFFLYAQMHNRK